ncbi:uncharacterized protein Dvir_GJ11355 [Drosophila virilis]|uniref:OAR domain-containing protein n=1 Tax=Drosophila virilis TaxID=7244 RepID=B4LSD4_DROVI|nr:uncharacterized protein Dvir_GJ11355 [Drosophila virilis]
MRPQPQLSTQGLESVLGLGLGLGLEPQTAVSWWKHLPAPARLKCKWFLGCLINCGFRPVLSDQNSVAAAAAAAAAAAQRSANHPPLFLPPHLAAQFTHQPLFPGLKGVSPFQSLCSCCSLKPPPLPPSSSASTSVMAPLSVPVSSSSAASSPESPKSSGGGSHDPRSNSVAELRRKAQEHSAALLQSLHAAAAAGLAFPGLHLPPLSFAHHPALGHAVNHNNNNNINNPLRLKHEAQDMTASTMNGLGPAAGTATSSTSAALLDLAEASRKSQLSCTLIICDAIAFL